jgi:hypothetical protein
MSRYETDFHAWIEEQAALLKAGQFARLDVPNLIDELESLGARERRELINRLTLLLTHLLKWQYQSELRCNRWRWTINEQRHQLALLLEDSPSLAKRLPEFLLRSYPNASSVAWEAIGFFKSPFPADCAFSVAEIMDEEFLPDAG